VLTHLNWGASYLVHDFYRRFVRREAGERHYVTVGRLTTIILFLVSSSLVFVLETAQDSFNIILQIGAGTGLLYLVRWFWWRVNAWCEVVAMLSSFSVSVAFVVLRKNGVVLGTHRELLVTVAFTTVCWLVTAYAAPATDTGTLVEFYKKVRPFGPGWRRIRLEAGVTEAEAAEYARHENLPLALAGWVSGSVAIWSALFTVGNWLYGRTGYAAALLALFAVSGAALVAVIRRLWS
jgi:SSS family solute:Na+ symporter